jgi:hypothetical protein
VDIARLPIRMRVQGEGGESWARHGGAHQMLRTCRDHAGRKHIIV